MKKVIALALSLMAISTVSYGQINSGEWKVNAGMWDTSMKIDGFTASGRWNLFGGLQYWISDKLSVRFDHYGLKNKRGLGNSNEMNVLYNVMPHVSLLAGYHIIDSSALPEDLLGKSSNNNHVVQLGFIADHPVNDDLDVYVKGAKGSKDTVILEGGVSYDLDKDVSLNAGYRYMDTKANKEKDITYKGFLAGLTYRFGGSNKKESLSSNENEQDTLYEYEPMKEEKKAEKNDVSDIEYLPAVKTNKVIEKTEDKEINVEKSEKKENDYYTCSIHFAKKSDVFDTTQLTFLSQVIEKEKETGHTFKLVAYTSGDADDDLAIRRVKAVASYLAAKGVDMDHLVGMYKDESHLSDADNKEDSEKNKDRVDIFEHK